jgi:alanine racemase
MKRPVWAEIDLKALAGNVREIRRVTDESAQIMAIVKANGYGHGVEHVSRVALQNGASWIGVALLQEAILLREKGIKAPILVLGYTPVDDIAEVIRYDISQTVFTWDDALAIASVANHLLRNNRKLLDFVSQHQGRSTGILPAVTQTHKNFPNPIPIRFQGSVSQQVDHWAAVIHRNFYM